MLIFSGIALAESVYSVLDKDSIPIWRGVPFLKKEAVWEASDEQAFESDSAKLQMAGSKTIQVIVGDGGTEVNQELHLSIQGEATRGVFVDALLSDVGREAGEERTATLREVDEVRFRVESEHLFLHLGDMTWRISDFGLSGLERATLGAAAGVKVSHSRIRGVYGFDELQRVTSTFAGVDGQQKGYLISSGTSDVYVSVVPHSETVYLNGKKLVRGDDYTVNYAGGVLDFLGTRIPGSQDEILVEFDAYNSGGQQILKSADGSYRGKNLWLDVAGFEISSDTARLRRNTWSAEDIRILKQDSGGRFDRADSLGELERPWLLRRIGARARMQWANRYYADGELHYGVSDTNTLSPVVDGPSGRAFRWFLSNDSTLNQRHAAVQFSVGGDYIEEGFFEKDFQGTVRNWNSYALREDWDLDSSTISGSLRSDEMTLRIKLPSSFFLGAEWGYRRSLSADEAWNSSRARAFLLHRTEKARGELSLVRVASFGEFPMERYQASVSAETFSGRIRPFGNASYGIWIKDSEAIVKNRSDKAEAKSGIKLVGDHWNSNASLFGIRARNGSSLESLEDSLRTAGFEHSANYAGKEFSFSHVLQYKRTDLDTAGASNSWISEESVNWGKSDSPFSGTARYRLGLTKEVPYVPIYKAVAPGTGDVLFDSLSGVFVENVDNGNFVYEGMGRSDSAESVRASSAEISLGGKFVPRYLGISNGVLRDLEFSFDLSSESRDTTGKTIYLPAFSKSSLRNMTSGIFSGKVSVLWSEPKNRGSLEYEVGTENEKRNTSQGYFENRLWHQIDGVYTGRKKEVWEVVPGIEFVELETFAKMDWKILEVTASWKRHLPFHLYVVPKAWLRKGDGKEENGTMDAFLRQASLTFGFDNEQSIRASDEFSATVVSTGNEVLPYQMVSGFGKGVTYRNALTATVDANEFLSLGVSYVVRFGSAENGVFQKMSMEARAYF